MKKIKKKIGRPVGSKDLKPRKRRCNKSDKSDLFSWKMGYECRAIKKNEAPKKDIQKRVKKSRKIKQAIPNKPIEKVKKGYVPQVFPDVKAYKLLGYCKCNAMISAKNLVSKLIYVCPICNKRASLKTLKNALDLTRIDKKDDREEIHRHIDTLPLNDHIIDPKDFKVQE